MNVGYFVHSAVDISETFVRDLVVDIDAMSNDLTLISGAAKSKSRPSVKTVYSGYYSSINKASLKTVYKLGQAFGRSGKLWSMSLRQKMVKIKLQPQKDILNIIDAAFIEYGISAALLYKVFLKKSIPFVIQVHAYDVTSAFIDKVYKQEFLNACEHANSVVVVSNHIKRILILAGVEEAKIHVIRLGIKTNSIQPISWDRRSQSAPSVIHLGRLTGKKHPIALIHAFALVRQKVKNAKLTMIGDGPLRIEVEQRIKRLGLEDCVQLTGALPREEAFELMKNHWVFAQHSVTSIIGDQEGFPVSPAEAAAHELPVVATAHSGITENIVDEVTGFLVQEHDYEAMSERIIYLLENPAEAERMGKAGRKRIIELCKPERRAEEIFRLLIKASLDRIPVGKQVGELAQEAI